MFVKYLRVVGDEFRSRYLNFTDAVDRTFFEEDWTRMKVVIVVLVAWCLGRVLVFVLGFGFFWLFVYSWEGSFFCVDSGGLRV